MTEFIIPEALPILSAGHHPWGSGKACAMDAVSFIYGKPEEGDAPRCVHPVLRSEFIRCNDTLPDSRRHELWPLILRAMGSADRAPSDELEAKRLNVGLAVWCARHVLHLVREQDRAVCEAAIEAAERWVADPTAENKEAASAAYAYAAYAAAAASSASDAASDAAFSASYAASSASSASSAASAADAASDAASAASDTAASAASASAAASAADAAYAAYEADASADARLASLTALLDEFDRITGTGTTADTAEIPWDDMRTALGATR